MAKKVVLIVVGSLLILVGLGATAVGAAILVVFGSNNTVVTGPHQVATPTHALVSPPEDIQNESSIAAAVGTPSVRFQLTTSQPGGVFIGIGPTSDVNRYLSGVAIDQVTDIRFTPYSLDTQRRNGSVTPPNPTLQSFWVAKSTGASRARVVWPVSDGSYRVVMMRADASTGLIADAHFGLTIPHIGSIAIGLLIGGLVVLAVGIVLLVFGIRSKSRPSASNYPYTPTSPPAAT